MRTARFLLPLLAILTAATLPAASFSFSGTFTQDDQVQQFSFNVGAPSTVTLRTWSYAGGTNAAGATIARGGFDPILALFDSTGLLIGQNDDGGSNVSTDLSNRNYDTFFTVNLGPGSYTVAVMVFDNFSVGPNLSDGFTRTGQGNFTATFASPTLCPDRRFCDVSESPNYTQRNGTWAFDILNVESADIISQIPEPSTWSMIGLAGLALAGVRRRRG